MIENKYFIPFSHLDEPSFYKWKIARILQSLSLSFTNWMMIFYSQNIILEGILVYVPKYMTIQDKIKDFSGWWLSYD
jgi:hypothetical protein